MKLQSFAPALLAVFSLGLPLSGLAKDRDKDRHHDDRHDYRHDDHRGSHGYSNYSYRSYSSRPYYYGSSYGYRPYYYSRPSIGIGIYSQPSTVYRSPVYRPSGLASDVQYELRRRGYYYGPVDGDIGPGTRAAIRRYQAEHRLYVTGRVDSSLVRSLEID